MKDRNVWLWIRDTFTDVAIELRSQPAKTVLLIAAVALSVGALVASVGISNSSARQIDGELAASTVRRVNVELSAGYINSAVPAPSRLAQESDESKRDHTEALGAPAAQGETPSAQVRLWPDDAIDKVAAIDTVDDVGLELMLGSSSAPISRAVLADTPLNLDVVGMTSGVLGANGLRTLGASQRWLDDSFPIAFLGERAANSLGIPVTMEPQGLSLVVGSQEYSVAGFITGDNAYAGRVVIPYSMAVQLAGSDATATMAVLTSPGAGSQVARTIRQVIMPQAPQSLSASQVISAEGSRSSVATQMAAQAAWIGAFLIVLAALLIANSMVVAVNARTVEIGVRRALGSSKWKVATVFWLEGGLIGFLGGLVGSTIGTWVILGVAIASGWTAVLTPLWIALGPLLGFAVGMIASAYPALRATRIQPAIAVRTN
ncbi:MAG: ABC transporter permease [Actinomycetaceae bacterium]|nr:ABC transporter permease [Arcanobacterium sp.]MDD7504502.1 ABC transporter permease [Actinomycetaceae bacterium]MDY6142829.1 ABC transporter permease [Arcanobacterium sp.]